MKKYLILPLALSALALLAITGCQSKEDDPAESHDTVVLSYLYQYQASIDSTTISAILYEWPDPHAGLVRVKLWPGETLTFNGHTIPEVQRPYSPDYVLRLKGYVDTGTFTYTSYKNIAYNYNMPKFIPRTLPAAFTSVNRHANDTVVWDGGPVNPDDWVNLSISGNSYTANVENKQQNYLALDSATMQTLSPGNHMATLYYVSQITSATTAPKSCSLHRSYIDMPREITVY